MKTKKWIAFLLCLTMMLTLVPCAAFAAGGSADKAKTKLVYMEFIDPAGDKYEPASKGPKVQAVPIPDELPDKFLIGIQLTEMTKLPADKVSENLLSFVTSLTYDSQYVRLVDDTNGTMDPDTYETTNFNDLVGKLRIGNSRMEGDKRVPTVFSKNYSLESGMTDTVLSEGSTWHRLNVPFKSSATGTKPAYDFSTDEYIAAFQFEVVNTPANGAQVFNFNLTGEDTNMAFGADGGAGSLSAGVAGENLLDYMDFDVSGANIFPESYTVSFDANGGAFASGTTVNVSVPETNPVIGDKMPENPTQTGKFFNGWVLDDNDNGTYEEDTDVTPLDETTTITTDMIGDDSTVKAFATWNDGHIITFEGNQGHVQGDVTSTSAIVTMSTTKTTLDGETIPVMERTAYTFDSWNTEQNGTGTRLDATNLTTHAFTVGDTNTLYAQWTPAADQTSVTVTFDRNSTDGVDANPVSKTIVSGQAIGTGNMPNVPTRATYTFESWNTEQNGSGTTFTETTAVPADITVYAQWTPADDQIARTVTFQNGNQAAATPANPSTKVVVNGDSIGETNMPAYPTIDGYYCTGWNTAQDGSGTPFTGTTPVTADIDVYAQWSENRVITFNENGGAFDTGFTDRTVTLDSTNKLTTSALTRFDNAVTKAGYTFCGWYPTANGAGTKITTDTEFTSSAAVYARWEAGTLTNDEPDVIDPAPNAILVKFNSNGGQAVIDPAMMSRLPNDALAANEDGMPTSPTREAFKFVGWNTKSNGEGQNVTFSTTAGALVSGGATEATVYAKWELDETQVPEADRVTITFHKNDGTAETKSITIKKGEKLNVATAEDSSKKTSYEPEYTRTPFTFDGWAKVEGGTAVNVDFDTEVISTDLDVYAKWTLTIDELSFGNNEQTYDGTPKNITVTAITVGGTQLTDLPPFEIEYAPAADPNNKRPSVTDAGEYIATIKSKDKGDSPVPDSITVTKYLPDNGFTIKQKGIPFVVGAQEVAVSEDNTDPKPLAITVSASAVTATEAALTANVKYYTFKDGVDKTKALTLDDLTEHTGAPTAQGDYVVSFTVSNPNYTASTLELEDGGTVVLYTAEAAPADPAKKLDPLTGVIKYSLVPDAKLEAVSVEVTNLSTSAVTAAALYEDNALTSSTTFDKAKDTYYVTIPTNSDVTIKLKGAFNPDTDSVYSMDGTSQTDIKPVKVAGTSDEWTVTLPKDKLAVAAGETGDGLFKNILQITIGSKPYSIKLKQQAEAKITLNYGNSPYGEIMKDAAITDKAAAKAAFAAGNKFTADCTPASMSEIAKKYTGGYGTKAWVDATGDQTLLEDPSVNIDRNDKAIFIYNGKAFKDPGFTAIDSNGKAVTTLDREITVSRVKATNFDGMKNTNQQESDTIKIAGKESEYLITEVTMVYDGKNDATRYIRPDVYEMEYSFYDTEAATTVSAIRKVVVLNLTGDTDMNGIINLQDRNFMTIMNSNNQRPPTWLKDGKIDVKESARLLYMYRVADTDANNIVNPQDRNALTQANSTGQKQLQLYYLMLPTQ